MSERLRDQAVRRLRSGYCRGAIGTDTFERRLEAVLTERALDRAGGGRRGDLLQLGEIELLL